MVERIEKLIDGSLTTNASNADIEHPASSFHQPLATRLPDAAAGQRTKEKPKTPPTLYTYNYKQKYTAWKSCLIRATKTPTAEQWALLDAVHGRCKSEHDAEVKDRVVQSLEEPLRLFIHGLPGSGKTKV